LPFQVKTPFNPTPKAFPHFWGRGRGLPLKKAAYRVPISRFFVHFFDNDSYFLPRFCEKFLCHHQIFFIEFIIFYLPNLPNKNKKPAFEEQAIIF